uniref:Genome polyprotein n=1 Tax=Porcine pegivirus TaxID=1869278 RepID=A0A411AIE4_9FLAV|nr:polyprotein [Porcine pegivirus]
MLLPILLVLPLVGGARTPASHACMVDGSFVLSNCCSPFDVYYCLPCGCLVRPGCTVCTDTCWDVYVPGVAVRPGCAPGELLGRVGGAFVPLAWAGYASGVLGLGEVYSAFIGSAFILRRAYSHPPNLTCAFDCQIPLLWLPIKAPEAATLAYQLFSWVVSIPVRILRSLSVGSVGVVLLALLLGLEQRVVQALLLLAAAGVAGASGDAELFSCLGCNGTWPVGNRSQVSLCKNGVWRWKVPCIVTPNHEEWGLLCPNTTNKYHCRFGSKVWTGNESAYTLVPFPYSALCSVTGRLPNGSDGAKCRSCVVDRRPSSCGCCWSDCWDTTLEKDLSFDRCGAGPRLTLNLTAISDPSGRGGQRAGRRRRHYLSWGYPGGYWLRKYLGRWASSNPDLRAPTRATPTREPGVIRDPYVVTVIGSDSHYVKCPTRLPPNGTWFRIPGLPSNVCLPFADLFSWPRTAELPDDLWRHCFEALITYPGSVLTCPGVAWDSPLSSDGMLHVGPRLQQVDEYTDQFPSAWFLIDFMFVILFLMKLAEARLVPLITVLVWWGFHNVVFVESCALAPVQNFFTAAWGNATAQWEKINNYTKGFSSRGQQFSEDWVLIWGNFTSAVNGFGSSLQRLFAAADSVPRGDLLRMFFECVQKGGCPAPALPCTDPPVIVTSYSLWDWVSWLASYLPKVEAAFSPHLLGGPMVGWASRQEGIELVLAFLCALAYLRVLAPGRLAALLAYKLAGGMPAAALMAWLAWSRQGHAVSGLTVCLELGPTFFNANWFTWTMSIIASWGVVTLALLTVRGRAAKLEWYGVWCIAYARARWVVRASPVGPFARLQSLWGLWYLASLVYPVECSRIALSLVCCGGFFDLADAIFESAVCTHTNLARLARLLDRLAEIGEVRAVRACLESCARRGVWFYDHKGHVGQSLAEWLRKVHGALEPAGVTPTDCFYYRDTAYTLQCGMTIRGLPVVARCGDMALIGVMRNLADLPPGFVPCAPIVVKKAGKGTLKVILTSLTGRDSDRIDGNICVLGTATTRSMGTCVAGVMYTSFHSSNGRTLAGPDGPLNPRWTSTSEDVAVYPVPLGMKCLDICGCSPGSVWVLRNDGALCHAEASLPQRLAHLDVSMDVGYFLGSSGSPILCDRGHAVGMLVAMKTMGHRAVSARFVVPWANMPQEVRVRREPAPVPAPGCYAEKPLFCPTGSGKTTKIPLGYVAQGHRVLVLNPSVATMSAIGDYVANLAGQAPSVYAGHGQNAISRTTDSKLTYCTYGRFLTAPGLRLMNCDVVICDECHSSDPTVLLGIGMVRLKAQEHGVKLVLFATATPPGTPMVPHPDIEEVRVDAGGDFPFYGHKLKLETLKHGRHLIFCHSRSETERVALALVSHGVKAVFHYRGRDVGAIPASGDLVVVSTDALCTGYTGDFDTVTDCGMMVVEEVVVTLTPTIDVVTRVRPVSADVAMQRRGRCGRGRRGTYYHLGGAPTPVGIVSSGAVWSAMEAAITWYNMSCRHAEEVLRLFGECPYTSHLPSCLSDARIFMEGLVPFVTNENVTRCRDAGISWPLLTGVQLLACRQSPNCSPPSDDPRWVGVEGTDPCPLLFSWGGKRPDRTCSHHIAEDLSRRLGEGDGERETGTGPILLVGCAVAAAVYIADHTGSLVVITGWSVGSGGSPAHPTRLDRCEPSPSAQEDAVGPPRGGLEDIKVAVEELEKTVGWEGFAAAWQVVTSNFSTTTANMVDAWYTMWGGLMSAGGRPAPPPQALRDTFIKGWGVFASNVNIIITGLTAAWAAARNPPLATAASGLLGIELGFPLEARLAAGLLVAGLGTAIGTPVVGCAMGGAFLAGGALGGLGPLSLLAALGCGWEATVCAAEAVYNIMTGKKDELNYWALVPVLAAPGAGVAGAALGLVLGMAVKNTHVEDWLNRLLSTLPKGTSLPDNFFIHQGIEEQVRALLRRLSLSRLLARLCECATQPEESMCGAVVDLFWAVKRFINWLITWLRARLPAVRLPIASCSPGYPVKGPWRGTGILEARCACGCVVTGSAREGRLRNLHWSGKFCRHYFLGTVPVNCLGRVSDVTPDPPDDDRVIVVAYGIGDYIKAYQKGGTVTVLASTTATLTRVGLWACLKSVPLFVDGRPACWGADCAAPCFPYGDGSEVLLNGELVVLPHILEGPVRAPPGAKFSSSVSEPTEEPGTLVQNFEQELQDFVEKLGVTSVSRPETVPVGSPVLELESWLQACDEDQRSVLSTSAADELEEASDVARRLEALSPYQKTAESVETSLQDTGGLITRLQEHVATTSKLLVRTAVAAVEAPRETIARRFRSLREVRAAGGKTSVWRLVQRCCGEDRSFSLSLPHSANVGELLTASGWKFSANHVPFIDGEPASLTEVLGTYPSRVTEVVLDCGPLCGDAPCGYSYVWSGLPLAVGSGRPLPLHRPEGTFVQASSSRVYCTDPRDVGERVEKVTINQRELVVDSFFDAVYRDALGLARTIAPLDGWTFEEAVAKLRSGAASGHNAPVTVAGLKRGEGKHHVEECRRQLLEGVGYHPFMLTAKQEVFYQDKKTKKPPRLIVFPSLEFRVVEKMAFGDPSRVPKAVLGAAYGFQYTPFERVKVLIDMWKSKRNPCAIVVDAKCFDSSITPGDVERETELYCAAYRDTALIRAISKHYAHGPMVNNRGVWVGERNCRASGVLTTSSSNCLTCYLKVKAATRKVKLKNASLLIHGDDCIIICERELPDDICDQLREALLAYGYDCEPSVHSSLDTAVTCSTFLAECRVHGGARVNFLSTDMRRALARACGGYGDGAACAAGYTIQYPHHPITRYVLIPLLLGMIFARGGNPTDEITCNVRGNSCHFPLVKLPQILVGLHGPSCLQVVSDSTKTLVETNAALQALGMRGLGYYRKRVAALRVRLTRAGGDWAMLARALLWHPASKPMTVTPLACDALQYCITHPYMGEALHYRSRLVRPWWVLPFWAILGACTLVCVLAC